MKVNLTLGINKVYQAEKQRKKKGFSDRVLREKERENVGCSFLIRFDSADGTEVKSREEESEEEQFGVGTITDNGGESTTLVEYIPVGKGSHLHMWSRGNERRGRREREGEHERESVRGRERGEIWRENLETVRDLKFTYREICVVHRDTSYGEIYLCGMR